MAREQQNKAPQAKASAPAAEVQPLPTAPTAEPDPKSDRYRVKGPGGLFVNGRLFDAGSVVQLSDADALSVFEHVEQV